MNDFFSNPLIVKEMRERFRSKRSFWILGTYLFVMGAILLGFLFITEMNTYLTPGENRDMFLMIAVIQYAMICFIAPALSAGAISGERERQTLHVLLTTHLSPGRIIISKLITSLAFIFLMVVATLPLYSFVFLYGGISPQQLSLFVLFLAINIIFFGALGIFCSTWIKRTGVSTITAYGLAFFFVVGTGLLCLFIGLLLSELYPDKYIGDEVFNQLGMQFLASSNPVYVMFSILGESIGPTIEPVVTPWLLFIVLYTILTVVLIIWSTYLLHPVRKRYWGWKK
ncbi:MAG TPA: ABC transporter permease subunit [Candidatus Bathyarchaeia archaeon]|nr:ABC transporter permease subunit [Candidatus Bathyarchaeia archaeon]